MVDPQRMQRGELLLVNDSINVPLGVILVDPKGGYAVDQRSDSIRDLQPGAAIVFMGLAAGEDDVLVVLADGELGWVFRDEVAQPE